MSARGPSLARLAVLFAVPLLGGCLEFETQTIEYAYDAANDRASLHLVYHGLMWAKGDAATGEKALQRAVDGGEFCLIDWPLHFEPKKLREKQHPAALLMAANLKTQRVGFFENADGQLAGGQIVTFDKVSELVKLANAELTKWLLESDGRPKDWAWDRHTRALLLNAAKAGHAWLRLRGNAVEIHAFCSDHDYRFLKAQGLQKLLEIKTKDHAQAILWLSALPAAWKREGNRLILVLGNPDGRSRFDVPAEGRRAYAGNLVEYAKKTWGYGLDAAVAPKLVQPDDTSLGRFARSLRLRERVRILLTQEGDAARVRLKAALEELPKEPKLDEEGGVTGFWQEWLRAVRRPAPDESSDR